MSNKGRKRKREPDLFERVIVQRLCTYHGGLVLSKFSLKGKTYFNISGTGFSFCSMQVVKFNCSHREIEELKNNKHPKFKN